MRQKLKWKIIFVTALPMNRVKLHVNEYCMYSFINADASSNVIKLRSLCSNTKICFWCHWHTAQTHTRIFPRKKKRKNFIMQKGNVKLHEQLDIRPMINSMTWWSWYHSILCAHKAYENTSVFSCAYVRVCGMWMQMELRTRKFPIYMNLKRLWLSWLVRVFFLLVRHELK